MQQHEGVEDSFIDERRGYLIQRTINDVRLVCTFKTNDVRLGRANTEKGLLVDNTKYLFRLNADHSTKAG